MEVLSDEALIEARSRLDPAAGVMLTALWVASTASWRCSSTIWLSTGCRGGFCWMTSTPPGLNVALARLWCCRCRGRRLPAGRCCWPSTRTIPMSWPRPRCGAKWRRRPSAARGAP
ncbi:linear gramicidin synthetase subunit D domain protein [Mycobacterium xenopi 4042]|uniref:Linear gramicidin synthetase subunit D domain protein n=1 Tax=Mycobacterium xenopi 4042 TaxID=1299334 RepID=X8AMR0_MYCXE|nr:linear gramicidin synthetase subunit D domain protein [Mycobacterium xenopi 4042]